MADARAGSKWRFLASPRWVSWHLLMLVSVAGMVVLGDWQLRRAEAGNGLSWAYTFEWPIFAVFVVVFWVKTIRDEVHPPAAAGGSQDEIALPVAPPPAPGDGPDGEAGPDGDADSELAAYNAYLARLSSEVKGHGRWHGLR